VVTVATTWAVGYQALFFGGGSNNTAIGSSALYGNHDGSNNVALGNGAGSNLFDATNDIYIGSLGHPDVFGAESNTIRIGTGGTQTQTFIAGVSGTAVSGTAVVVSSSEQLGVATSSARFKEDIHSMNKASEALLALRPVTFRYKKEIDPASTAQFGLVAEEVEKVNPDLVARDKEGKPYTVRYEAVNAMLLNEFLKEHKKVEDLEKDLRATIVQQQKEIKALAQLKPTVAKQEAAIAALTASLKEQASQIQKVSDQLELSKAAPRTVVNNR
jgi:trimeric autotransporter adhesin